MKRTKTIKYLFLLFIAVSSILFISSITPSAVRNDGSTEVIAHIETSPTEATQPSADNNSSSVPCDENDVSTGDMSSGDILFLLILILISALVIFLCSKNSNNKFSKD